MHSDSLKAQRSTLLWLIVLGAGIGLLIDIALHQIFFFAWQRQDQTWLLYAAARVLDGTQLYGPRLVETNPPLIIWLCTLPAWLAIHLHLQPLLVLHSLVALLVALSSAWSVRILRAAGILRGRTAAFAAFAILLVVQTRVVDIEFGEREHILVLLLVPYLFASFFPVSRSLDLAERLALGLCAGLAGSIKPQYALIPIGTELFLSLWYRQLRRLWRPELLTLILTGLAYIAAVCYFTPLYFSQVVPILRDTYPSYRGIHPALSVMFQGLVYDLSFVAILLVWIVYRRALRYPVAPLALIAASFFASVSFAIQQSGWSYQAVPRTALLLVAAFWLAAELVGPAIARLQPDKHFRLLYTVIVITILLPGTLFSLKRAIYGRNFGPLTLQQQVYSTLPPGTTVYVLSTNFYNFSEIVHDNLRWGGRYVHLWMLPAIILNENAASGGPPAPLSLPPARVQQLATLLRSNVADDLHTFAPAIVFIEHCIPSSHPCFALEDLSFDTLAWFQRSPAFAAEWQNYHLERSTSDFDVYARNTPSQ